MVTWENITVKDLTEKLGVVYRVSARCEIDPSRINLRALVGVMADAIASMEQYKHRASFYSKTRRKKNKLVLTSPQ